MRHRGFALMMVLMALAIVGALVWEIGLWTRQRAATTTTALRDAQIQQLVLAGIEFAPRVLSGEPAHLEISVPRELDAHVTLDRVNESGQVRITVQYGGVQREQLAGFSRSGDAWHLAQLMP